MKFKLLSVSVLVIACLVVFLFQKTRPYVKQLPLIAVANYGQHASLQAAIEGMQEELAREGYINNKNIRYIIQDVNFDLALIAQMIANLKNERPEVMVVMATPIAQFAKEKVHNIPLVYGVITDPLTAGLIKAKNVAGDNITGSSDQQNLPAFLTFVKRILPHAKRVGLLYSIAEANDAFLLKNLQKAAQAANMELIALPIDAPRDIPIKMQAVKGKADFIYVGVSGTIQPTLPVIAAEALKMNIPVFNADDSAVHDGLVLGSYGVNYKKVGANIGKLVAMILKGKKPAELEPLYPEDKDSHAVINRKQALKFKIALPKDLH